MSVSLLSAEQVLGLFELDALGKVLYYRMDSAGTSPDLTGHNFYDEVARFANVEAFRRCVTDFDFDCQYDGSDHPVRVLLARISERLNRNDTKSVLVHIKSRRSAA
jgi:hypothetical protein